jgi:phosphoglucosamine mutase
LEESERDVGQIDFGETLKKMGIENVITGVGDRYVMEEMCKQGAVIGGEESGHTVFLDYQTTGDGLLTALKLLEIMKIENKPLSELKSIMSIFPQVLIMSMSNTNRPWSLCRLLRPLFVRQKKTLRERAGCWCVIQGPSPSAG